MRTTAIVLAAFLVGALLFALPARAGDDARQQLVLPADGGVVAVCSTLLRPKTNYAVQPGADSYVAVSKTGDGGIGLVTTSNVLVGANKLYDVATTSDQQYICCKRAAASATAANCNILEYRGKDQ